MESGEFLGKVCGKRKIDRNKKSLDNKPDTKLKESLKMKVTALIQNNTLIIPNVDLSQLAPYADNHGMIEFDPSLLEMLMKLKVAKNPSKKGKSIQELAGGLAHKTTVVATVEEMNDSIGQVYANREI